MKSRARAGLTTRVAFFPEVSGRASAPASPFHDPLKSPQLAAYSNSLGVPPNYRAIQSNGRRSLLTLSRTTLCGEIIPC